jgi:hypothetical protein
LSDSTEHLLMMTISVIDISSGGTGKNTDGRPISFSRHRSRPTFCRWTAHPF